MSNWTKAILAMIAFLFIMGSGLACNEPACPHKCPGIDCDTTTTYDYSVEGSYNTEDSFNSYNTYSSYTEIQEFFTKFESTTKDSYNTVDSFNTIDSNNDNTYTYQMVYTDGTNGPVTVTTNNIKVEGSTLTFIDASTNIEVTINVNQVTEVKEPKEAANGGSGGNGGDQVLSKAPILVAEPDFDHPKGAIVSLKFTTCGEVQRDCVTGKALNSQRTQMWLENTGDAPITIRDWTPKVNGVRITRNIINDITIDAGGIYPIPEVVNLTAGTIVEIKTREDSSEFQQTITREFNGVNTDASAEEMIGVGGWHTEQAYRPADEPNSLLKGEGAVMTGAADSSVRYGLPDYIGHKGL